MHYLQQWLRRMGCVVLLLPFGALQAQTVSNTDASHVVHTLSEKLTEGYPFPEIAARYKAALEKHETAGRYFNLTEDSLAARITTDLQAAHKDVHLRVWRDANSYKPRSTVYKEHEDEQLAAERRGGYGFQQVTLDGATSTAYINIPGGFKNSQEAFEMAASAMGMAAYSKHVIIDLRHNGGGSGQMGRFLASYFYTGGHEQFYLNGFHKDRSTDEQEWTYAFVPGHRMPDATLYILVDHNTASASEGFAYAMQQLHRGTVVGDTTAGAGIAGSTIRLGSNLVVFLPVKMVTAPHSTVGWEGTGVIPDIATKGPDALDAARHLIMKDIAADEKDPVGQALAKWRLEEDSATGLQGNALKKKYAALVGRYNQDVTITADKTGLRWNRLEEGRSVKSYALRELMPDVLTVVDMNLEYGGPNCSRVYIHRLADGKIENLIRKTVMNNGSIYISPTPYTRN